MEMDRIVNQEDASHPSIEPPSSPPPFLAPYPILGRKRTRAPEHTEDSTPSDGPLFSSDPPDPSVDEYFQPRRKRQYRGTWWGEITREDAPAEPALQRTKNAFSRNMDSGVWMGSDVTDEDQDLASDDTSPDLELLRDMGRHAVARNATQPVTARILPRASFVAVPPRLDNTDVRTLLQTAEDKGEARAIELARSKIQYFLDHSVENIALCNSGLIQLPDEVIEPLHTLFRDPSPFDADNTDGETEEEFQARGLIPRIKLDLSNNALQILPHSLFDLQNITKLDLSYNNLTQLPRHIGKLENLGSLDVSGNRLRWLPWELVQLCQSGKLKAISLDHNPFLQPFSYVSCFGSWDRPWIPPIHLEAALDQIRSKIKNWQRFQKAKSDAAAVPGFNKQPYEQAIEHAKWITRFHINYTMQASYSGADELLWKAEPPHTIHVASTPVVQFGVDGRLLRGQQRCAPSSLPVDEFVYPALFEQDHITWIMDRLADENKCATLDSQALAAILRKPGPQHASSPQKSAVPSLFELALQSATKGSIGEHSKYDIQDLLRAVCDEDPETFRQGVQTAIDVHTEGGRVCTVCSRPFIIARTEWVEYWYLGRSFSADNTKIFIPILRRGCSPNCAAT
ncbi:leucine rich repeat domain protein [Venturia nashicola]|nr:leucine rich repeat domain protein [Venturia nashicola]